jgi:hypothetical protein
MLRKTSNTEPLAVNAEIVSWIDSSGHLPTFVCFTSFEINMYIFFLNFIKTNSYRVITDSVYSSQM